MATEVHCKLAGICSGCPWLGKPYASQREAKVATLASLGPVTFREVAPSGLRDRADLICKRHGGEKRLGFYSLVGREVVDVADCPQMSPELAAWFESFRKNLPAIEAGSLRLRVSPEGKRGVWLDFSNIDVKKLLDERTWLTELASPWSISFPRPRTSRSYPASAFSDLR